MRFDLKYANIGSGIFMSEKCSIGAGILSPSVRI